MPDRQDSTEEHLNQNSPLSRPQFVIAAVLVLVIVVLGVVVAVRVARAGGDASSSPLVPSASANQTSSPANTSTAGACDVPGGSGSTTDTAPAVTWNYQGTTAYPTSPEFGPTKTAQSGYRYCFQHSPAGAAVMAANSLVQGSDPSTGRAWAQYALGQGPYRDQLETQIGTAKGAQDTRIKVVGVRVLQYTDASARVDLATQVSSQNQNLYLSAVYELVWQDGDWKISADVARPLDTATIPDVSGYLPWGE